MVVRRPCSADQASVDSLRGNGRAGVVSTVNRCSPLRPRRRPSVTCCDWRSAGAEPTRPRDRSQDLGAPQLRGTGRAVAARDGAPSGRVSRCPAAERNPLLIAAGCLTYQATDLAPGARSAEAVDRCSQGEPYRRSSIGAGSSIARALCARARRRRRAHLLDAGERDARHAAPRRARARLAPSAMGRPPARQLAPPSRSRATTSFATSSATRRPGGVGVTPTSAGGASVASRCVSDRRG